MHILETLLAASQAAKRKLLLRTRALRFARKVRDERVGIRILGEAIIDLHYGGWCGGVVPPNPNFPDASRVQSARYSTLKKLFDPAQVPVRDYDVLVDVGCGKGRAINFWLHQGYTNHIIGMDLHERVAQRTAQRLSRFGNVKIEIGNALDLLPADGTIFYLYNPFGLETMREFVQRVLRVSRAPDRVRIVYLNAIHTTAFSQHDGWALKSLETGGREAAVLAFQGRATL